MNKCDYIDKIIKLEKELKESRKQGCVYCNKLWVNRAYRSEGYEYCPHCGTSLEHLEEVSTK